MRVLVCGGRDYQNRERVFHELNLLKPFMTALITGGARGADKLAEDWGWQNLIAQRFPADWHKHGRAAGPIRNQKMIDEGKPDLVIAFGGSRGTADMISRAQKAGVSVLEIDR